MLVRKYVAAKLHSYYAQPARTVVGGLTDKNSIINFRNLFGEFHWKRKLAALYNDKSQGQWLTPVELFQPFYSQCIANWICNCIIEQQHDTHDVDPTIEIVELGGGRGTNCLHILNHLAAATDNLYDKITQYRILDASPTLLQYQRDRLQTTKHADKVQVVQCDLLDVAEGRTTLFEKSTTTTITIVLALEVLDNLPHDKIRVKRDGNQSKKYYQIEQAELERNEQEQYTEVFRPLSDPLLKSILETAPYNRMRHGSVSWIPTVACGGILNAIAKERPNNKTSLLMADFDWLPPPDVAMNTKKNKSVRADEGEPLVTDMNHHDYACYLTPDVLLPVDILFPTNFNKLAMYAQGLLHQHAKIQVAKQSEFIQRFGKAQIAATSSRWTGYSPLVDDFANCSVLTITT